MLQVLKIVEFKALLLFGKTISIVTPKDHSGFTHYKKMLLRPRFKNAAIGPKNAA